MRYYYDLHIHSCLSPCADDDMTPSDIAGMAKITGLDIIAVSDHNSVANVRAVMEAAESYEGPLVIPAMEMETSENIHVLILFGDINNAEEFEKTIWADCFRIKNRKDIYGNQLLMDAGDTVIEEREDLLLVATNIGIYEVSELSSRFGGVAIPAHVDRESHGALKILGGLDPTMGMRSAELSPHASDDDKRYLEQNGYKIVYNSDAHRLEQIQDNEGNNYLELDKLTVSEVLNALK